MDIKDCEGCAMFIPHGIGGGVLPFCPESGRIIYDIMECPMKCEEGEEEEDYDEEE